MADYIWGRYPVLEALRSKRRVQRILVAQGPRDASLDQVLDQARRVGVPVETSSRRRLDDLTHNANHQGVMAVTSPREYAEVEDILARARTLGEDALVLALDAIQDVQNLGSLIRTAEAVGAHGVIIPEHRAAGLTPAVDKTSAGAVEFLPIARVTNMTRMLDDLKKQGLWCIGLDGEAELTFERANLTVKDMDVIELNEAFASQAIAVMRDLDLPSERTNPNGSGISIGHPVGATGCMLVTKALYELRRIGGKYALVTMCIGGGQGIAAVFEAM